MTITVGVDTYGTVAEADAYFLKRYGFAKWPLADNTTKEQALVSATQLLDLLCNWYGYKADSEQELAFPRYPDANPTPDNIKFAQFEIAYAIIDTGSLSTNPGDPLTELKAGSVTFKFEPRGSSNPLVNNAVRKLISPFGLCSGSGSTTIIPLELC